MQFYTNNFAAPEKSARKKIHGGSGAVGDGYTPGCASSSYYFLTLFLLTFMFVFRICWGCGGTAAAFLEFHAPLAAWIHPQARGPEGEGEDTLLASGEVYNNFVRLDVWYKGSGSA